jgi:hypothetical protein
MKLTTLALHLTAPSYAVVWATTMARTEDAVLSTVSCTSRPSMFIGERG